MIEQDASLRIYPLTEAVLDDVVERAGGIRAHPDQDRRTKRGADYVVGATVIELKILDDEGLAKAERQQKLAELFQKQQPGRPVYVLDPDRLDERARRHYDQAMASRLQRAVKKAKTQLAQSRREYPETTRSVIMIVNNGNSSLDHRELLDLATRRVRNNTSEVDGLIVVGAYLYGDGIEAAGLWPFEYVPIRLDADFPEYDALLAAYQALAQRAMTDAIINGPSPAMSKGPVVDVQFEVDGICFVRPAPPMGRKSEIYVNGRPRINSSGIETLPNVGIIIPDLSRAEWKKFHRRFPDELGFRQCYEEWLSEMDDALEQHSDLAPLVPIAISFDDWLASWDSAPPADPFVSACDFATATFRERLREVIDGARDGDTSMIIPPRFILAETEMIGRDKANDVSHIWLFEQAIGSPSRAAPLAENLRIFHEHACYLGAAYAIKHGVTALYWRKDKRYAWT